MKKKPATKRKYTRKPLIPAAFSEDRLGCKILEPSFDPGIFLSERSMVTDNSGRFWVIDPKKGTIVPVKVKS